MAVAIGAAALLSYNAEIQRTNTAKALQLIAQIEGLKANLRKQIDFGEQAARAAMQRKRSSCFRTLKWKASR